MNLLLKASLATLLISQYPICADNGYDTEFVDLVETAYGTSYLSQGGCVMEERMFEGFELEGKTILDLGCGIGGPALHLIKNHHVTLVGIDPEAFMIWRSRAALNQLCKVAPLKGSAYFAVMEDPLSLQQFPDESFDIVTSKEAILHVPIKHKLSYFQEIFRVLKAGGQLVILDWQHSSSDYSDSVKAMVEMYGLISPKEYYQIVAQAGFVDVTLTDLTGLSAEQTQQDLATIEAAKLQIIENIGRETYDSVCNSWNVQGQAFKNRELLIGLIRASKP